MRMYEHWICFHTFHDPFLHCILLSTIPPVAIMKYSVMAAVVATLILSFLTQNVLNSFGWPNLWEWDPTSLFIFFEWFLNILHYSTCQNKKFLGNTPLRHFWKKYFYWDTTLYLHRKWIGGALAFHTEVLGFRRHLSIFISWSYAQGNIF